MKVSIVFAVLYATVWAADDWKPTPKDKVKAMRAKCDKEHKVPAALNERTLKFDYADEPSIRCALKCLAEAVGAWDQETGWIADRIEAQARNHAASVPDKDNLNKCIDARLEGEDDCKWTYRNFMCMLDNKYIVPKVA